MYVQYMRMCVGEMSDCAEWAVVQGRVAFRFVESIMIYLSERAHQISHFRNTSRDGQGHRRAICQVSRRQRQIHKPGARIRRADNARREVRTASTVTALSYNHITPASSPMVRAHALRARVQRARARVHMWPSARHLLEVIAR